MNALSRNASLVFVVVLSSFAAASPAPCATCARPVCTEPPCVVQDSQPSWVFRRSTYSHDPETGVRVAQYMRTPPVEPLEDERNVSSRYRRIQTNLRGADGSNDTTYEVQAWGNGRGGMDAEWERFHSAWKESYLQNGYFNGPANGGPGWNGGWNGPGWNGGGWNGGGWNGGGWNGGGWNGGGWNGGGWNGGGWNGGGWNGGGWNGLGPRGHGNWGPQGPWQGPGGHGQGNNNNNGGGNNGT